MGLSRVIYKEASFINNLQTGYIYHYALSILIGCTLLIFTKQCWFFLSSYIDFRIIALISVMYTFCYFGKIKL